MQHESGVGTLLDTRRTRDYDADNLVDQYLNLKEVQVSSIHSAASASSVTCARKLLEIERLSGCTVRLHGQAVWMPSGSEAIWVVEQLACLLSASPELHLLVALASAR